MATDVLLLNQKCAHTVSLYDVQSGKALKHIRLPNYPHEFVVDSKQEFAYVGHYGILGADCVGDQGGCSVFVIDLHKGEHVHTLSTWPFYRIHGLAMDQQDRLYAMSEGHSTLLIFDQPRNAVAADRAVPSGGYKTHLFALSRDGETAYGINLLSNTVTKIKPHDPVFAPVPMYPGRKPEGNCLSADETRLFVTNRLDNTLVAIDTGSLQIVGTASTGEDPNRVYRDPTGRLLTTNYGESSLSVFDEQLNSLGTITLPHRPIAISFHPNGELAFVSFKGDQIGILDLHSGQFVRFFDTLAEPDVSCLLRLS